MQLEDDTSALKVTNALLDQDNAALAQINM
jgi:hypothetical protein